MDTWTPWAASGPEQCCSEAPTSFPGRRETSGDSLLQGIQGI